jgi:hypothetical protein
MIDPNIPTFLAGHDFEAAHSDILQAARDAQSPPSRYEAFSSSFKSEAAGDVDDNWRLFSRVANVECEFLEGISQQNHSTFIYGVDMASQPDRTGITEYYDGRIIRRYMDIERVNDRNAIVQRLLEKDMSQCDTDYTPQGDCTSIPVATWRKINGGKPRS